MPARDLPARPNLEQYRKQAKDLLDAHRSGDLAALRRMQAHHRGGPSAKLTDAQLVIAREHGFESWPKFAAHVETLRLSRSLDALADPVAAFIEAACVPRDAHASGTLEHAELILERYPHVARANIHAAAILADEEAVRAALARDPALATAHGGPRGWDALTHLCFSRYMRLDPARAGAFVLTARALLDAGASARTGWHESVAAYGGPIFESAIYGAAGIAGHPELTRLLLERGADPNDGETPYHVPDTYDNTVMRILLESGTLNPTSLSWMLLRKVDWHDREGLRLLLDHHADPNLMTRFGDNGLHHALRRDNALESIELLLDRGADPARPNARDGRTAYAMAAWRGRGDVLRLLERRGALEQFHGVDRLVAACAMDERDLLRRLRTEESGLEAEIVAHGGTPLAEFAGTGNAAGVGHLLDLGVNPSALYEEGDGYFDIARDSTALHVAAWRAWPDVVKTLIARGAPVNATDGKGRTALQLAVKACVDSYWTGRRSPDSVRTLLEAGASASGIKLPSGYDEIDRLLMPLAG